MNVSIPNAPYAEFKNRPASVWYPRLQPRERKRQRQRVLLSTTSRSNCCSNSRSLMM